MTYIRPKDSDVLPALASNHEIMLDGPDGFGTMARDAFIAAVAALIAASPSTYKLATLDGADKLTSNQDPSMPLSYIAVHDVAANSPALADGTGTTGDTYQISNGGSRDYGSGSITLAEGDALVYNGSAWQKVPNVANILNGIATAAAARTTLEVNSKDESAETTAVVPIGSALRFSANDYIEFADDGRWTFATSTDDLPFSVYAKINGDSLISDTIISKFGGSAPNQEWSMYFDGSGKLNLSLRDSAGDFNGVVTDDALTGYKGKWLHVLVTYGGSGPNSNSPFANAHTEINIYVNGVAIATSQNNSGTYDGMSDSSQAVAIGRRGTTDYFDGLISNVVVFTYELSSDESVQLTKTGQLNYANEWAGARGAIESSDFSAGADGWGAIAGSAAGNIDGIGGQNDTLRLTVNTASADHYLYKTISGLIKGKRYRVEADVYIPSGNSHLDGVIIGNAFSSISKTPTADTWTRISGDVIATDTLVRIYGTDGGVISFQDAGGDDLLYVKNFKVTQIGILADLRAEDFNESAGKLLDRSSNNFVGTNNGATLVGARRHVSADTIDLKNLPTSSAGLSAGEVWSNFGVLTVVT